MVLRVPKLSSFSRIALMRASETCPIISWILGLTLLSSAGAKADERPMDTAIAARGRDSFIGTPCFSYRSKRSGLFVAQNLQRLTAENAETRTPASPRRHQ